MAKHVVRTAKQLMKKSTYINLALFSYRATPVVQRFSRSELLMSHHLNMMVAATSKVLTPEWDDSNFRQKNETY